MKRWLIRILILMFAVMSVFCCMGMEVNCVGEYKGINCGIDGCRNTHYHNFKIIEEVKATCTEEGYTKAECTNCHYINTVTQYPLGHDFDLSTTLHRGICHEGDDKYFDGSWYNELVCARSECDYIGKEFYYEGPNLHFYDEGEVTSLDECGCGEITYTCLICGYKDVVSSGLHSDDSPQQQELNELYAKNTCGTYLATCELCQRTVTKTWHKWTQEEYLVEPTETEYGLLKHTCLNNCRYPNKTTYSLIPPTGNN